MSAHDNVIPFPGAWNGSGDHPDTGPDSGPDSSPDTGPDYVAQLFAEVMKSQSSPDAFVASPFRRRHPEPLSPPTEVTGHRVRVELDDTLPLVWRILDLAGDTTLAQLHETLQTAIGWTGSHLHNFLMGPDERDHRVQPFATDFDEPEDDSGVHERDVRLDQVLQRVGDRLYYDYDFGDGWEHTLTLEATTPLEDGAPRARCVAGDRAAPPEDCGGIPGFDDVLTALASPDPADPRSRHLLEWLPAGYDPAVFSPDEVNDLLDAAVRVSSPPSLDGLIPPLQDLISNSQWGVRSPLTRLVESARLQADDVPSPEIRAAMVRPWLHLLDVVGDGMALTGAGYLKPAVVRNLVDTFEWSVWGKGNREEHTPPVANLRHSASVLGLLRKAKGRLLPTRLGRAIAADPDSLWGFIISALPAGDSPETEQAGAIALLAVAAGESPRDVLRGSGSTILAQSGWRRSDGGPLEGWMTHACARSTLDLLELLGATRSSSKDEPTPSGQQVARLALRSTHD